MILPNGNGEHLPRIKDSSVEGSPIKQVYVSNVRKFNAINGKSNVEQITPQPSFHSENSINQAQKYSQLSQLQDPASLRSQKSQVIKGNIQQFLIDDSPHQLNQISQSAATENLVMQNNSIDYKISNTTQSPQINRPRKRMIKVSKLLQSADNPSHLLLANQRQSAHQQSQQYQQQLLNIPQQKSKQSITLNSSQIHKGNTYFQDSELQDFEIIRRLGEGSFSTVYQVRRGKDGKDYALKRIKMAKLNEKEKENAINEIRFLASISCNNIVSYKQAIYDEKVNQLCVIMELAEGGDLSQIIRKAQKAEKYIDEEIIWSYAIQMTRGIKALHDISVLHRDLKSANVFLDKYKQRVMLGDFNVSKKLKSDGLLYTQTGTPYYASPEVWKDKPYNSKSDIWSLGCVIYEMAALKPPFKGKDMDELFKKVQRGEYEPIPQCYSQNLRTFISQILRVNPDHRPNCSDILKMSSVHKKMSTISYFQTETTEDEISKNELLNTIRIGKTLSGLKERLPQSRYENKSFDQRDSLGDCTNTETSNVNQTQQNKKRKQSSNLFPNLNNNISDSAIIDSQPQSSAKREQYQSKPPQKQLSSNSPDRNPLGQKKSRQKDIYSPYSAINPIKSKEYYDDIQRSNSHKGLCKSRSSSVEMNEQRLNLILKPPVESPTMDIQKSIPEIPLKSIQREEIMSFEKQETSNSDVPSHQQKQYLKQKLQQVKVLESILNQKRKKGESLHAPQSQNSHFINISQRDKDSLKKSGVFINNRSSIQQSLHENEDQNISERNNSKEIQYSYKDNNLKRNYSSEKQSFVQQNQLPVLPQIYKSGFSIEYKKSNLSLITKLKSQATNESIKAFQQVKENLGFQDDSTKVSLSSANNNLNLKTNSTVKRFAAVAAVKK